MYKMFCGVCFGEKLAGNNNIEKTAKFRELKFWRKCLSNSFGRKIVNINFCQFKVLKKLEEGHS